MASSPGQRFEELQTCSGLGWVKFDPSLRQKPAAGMEGGAATSAIAAALVPPRLRCLGMRLSQEVTPDGDRAAARGGSKPSEPSAQGNAAASRAREALGEISENTWSLVCAGQLSMVLPMPASSPSTGAGVDSSSTWEPCAVRCDGISFRIDRVPETTASEVMTARAARSKESEQEKESLPEAAEGRSLQAEDLLAGALRGAQAVAGRAGAIVQSLGRPREPGTARDRGPATLAWDTAAASKRICVQAGKITRRSVEQVGRIVAFPFRVGASDNEPKPGQGSQ
eukprot:TRINITY_DN107541_c0_g1_i1.p1 TRINITY_DN107541_c0_g1~~TRINITY_DN107541_c0_g1_i1.p1  ORF type:complete len:293 (+),score=54.63 TRINITY_DN107541_c0_g1_i1:31-879(+)